MRILDRLQERAVLTFWPVEDAVRDNSNCTQEKRFGKPLMDRSVFVKQRTHPIAEVIFGTVAVTALVLFAGTVHAAPQSLGLVTTAQPVPMICGDGGCVAQLSSFCLQKERKPPSYHTPYRVAEGAEDYVAKAVALGTAPDARNELETRIRASRSLVFEDQQAVDEFHRLMLELIQVARS